MQGPTLNEILMRAAHCMTYFDLANYIKLKLMHWKRSNPNYNGNRRDKVALRKTCIKTVNFKIIKTRTGCRL